MSEHYLYVACTCFRDGIATEPPVSRELLDNDRFGNVKRIADRTGEDSPENLYQWREHDACEHDYMRIGDEIFHGTRAEWDHPVVEQTLKSEGFEAIDELFHRRPSGDADVFATAAEASRALPELRRLLETPTGISSRVLVDARARVSGPLDPRGYTSGVGFTRLADSRYPKFPIEGITELGLGGFEFVVRSMGDRPWESSRSRTLLVSQDDYRSEVRIGGSDLYRTLFQPGEGGHPTWGWAPRFWFFDGVVPPRNRPYVAPVMRVELREQAMCDLEPWLRLFDKLLRAAEASGNPVVSYYSGHSLGF
ncbi:MAG: hypothetical protein QM655_08300 [Nocardioidaceae bacterium]